MLTILHRLLGGSVCFVGRIVGPELLVHEALDPHGLGVTRAQSVPLLDTVSGVVERTRATAVCDDESPIACPFERNLGLRSGLAVPLLQRDGNIIGTLCAFDRTRRSYSAQDVELVVDLARVVVAELEEGQVLDRAVELERVRLAGLLARGLAHDFGNVVSSALANVRSLHRALGDHPQAREPLEELSASLEAGRELVARLREVGRSDAGHTKRRGMDPTAVASKVVALARALFSAGHAEDPNDSAKWVDLRLVPPDDAIEIRGDEHALEQALLNLVLNARDAVGARGGRVTVRVISERLLRQDLEHPWHAPGEWAVLAVDDDGPGIDPRARAKLFEPGFTTKGERGSGLGLFLVQTTATAHGGGVMVTKSPEGGARVAICLPARSRASVMMSAVSAGGAPASTVVSSSKRDLVLVADDERGLRRACARELSAAGIAVAEAASRAAALELVDADPKRIVAAIIDRDLGDGSGEDVVRRIRALNPKALIIETSGASDLFTESGAPVLEKPFDLQALVDRVLRVVKAKAATDGVPPG